jgi:hypothetical protein
VGERMNNLINDGAKQNLKTKKSVLQNPKIKTPA